MSMNRNGSIISSREFLRISELYGWKLHSYLQNRTSDQRIREELYSQIICTFCAEAHHPGHEERTLFLVADRICAQRKVFCQPDFEEDTPQKGSNLGFCLLLVLLLVLIGLCLWVLLGLLMELGLIPYLDLGHGWMMERLMNLLS